MEDTILTSFGKAVRNIRQEKGFSQESFALKAEIHRTYIGGIERGERNPTLTSIFKIARALEVEPEILFEKMRNIDVS